MTVPTNKAYYRYIRDKGSEKTGQSGSPSKVQQAYEALKDKSKEYIKSRSAALSM